MFVVLFAHYRFGRVRLKTIIINWITMCMANKDNLGSVGCTIRFGWTAWNRSIRVLFISINAQYISIILFECCVASCSSVFCFVDLILRWKNNHKYFVEWMNERSSESSVEGRPSSDICCLEFPILFTNILNSNLFESILAANLH